MSPSEAETRQSPKPRTIFYVGSFRFPDAEAGAHRVHGVGRALRGAGYHVEFLGTEGSGRPQDAVPGGGYRFDGFPYHPARNLGNGPFRRVYRLWYKHLSGLSAMSRLRTLWTESAVAVFAYQASSPLLAQLRQFCDRRSAGLVTDVVEWYDRRHVNGGRFGPLALDSELRMRFMNGRADGVVAISRYLESYYGRAGSPTVRVPPLVNLDGACWQCPKSERRVGSRLQLAFVGSAGQKDLVVNAIRGIGLLGSEARECELTMVGPCREELRLSLGREAGLLETLRGSLHFAGRLPHAEALQRLAQASFSIVLRPDQRFAHAGFPTKLVESLSMGVPVICNLTGDIGMYVCDGVEGIVVPDSSPGAFADGVRRALGLNPERRRAMSKQARQRAEVSFDYRNWVLPLRQFMAQVLPRKATP